MIERIRLANSGLETTRLGFGTSRLHYASASRASALVGPAFDLGLQHFDTAPAYGDGLAEREVGDFLKGRRADVIVATKYGIAADPLLDTLPALAPPLRIIRAGARRAGFWRMRSEVMTGAGLRRGVERSLRRLNTTWIDVLLLHEPAAGSVPRADDLLAEVIELRRRGLIRHFGVSGAWRGIAGLDASVRSAAGIVQTAEREWPPDQPPDITYGVLAGASQSAFSAKSDIPDAAARLQAALRRRPDGAVLVSTTSTAHLEEIVRAARRTAP